MPCYELSEKTEIKISRFRYYSCTVAGDEIPMFVQQINKIKAVCYIIKDNCDYSIDTDTIIYDTANGNMVVAFLFKDAALDAKFILTNGKYDGKYEFPYRGYDGSKYIADITLNNKHKQYSIKDNNEFDKLCKDVKY